MKAKTVSLIFLSLLLCLLSNAQETKSSLSICIDSCEYIQSVDSNGHFRMIELNRLIPGIALDIRYAGTNNFSREPFYTESAAFLRLPAALALAKVQKELKSLGLGLIVYDAYRPYSVTCKIYNKVRDTLFAAPPWTGSRHNRGCAIDLNIIRLASGKEIKMPTPFDEFSPKAAPGFTNLPDSIKTNRDFLIAIMGKYGFEVNPSEWWHYDYKGWNIYPLMDLNFKQLRSPVFLSNAGMYIEEYLYISLHLMISYGIPASVILGIAFVESGGCNSRNCKLLNNHFGIKGPKRYKIPHTKSITSYRSYDNSEDSFKHFAEIISKRKFYPDLKDKMNYRLWVKAIGLSGYARSHSSWKAKVNSTIVKYQLQHLDTE